MRLHHAIFMEKLVLTAIARTNGALPTETHTMLFRSSNKLSHMLQANQIIANPRYPVRPLCPCPLMRPCTQQETRVRLTDLDPDLVFSLLHLDLDLDLHQKHLKHPKREEGKKSTSSGAPTTKSKGKTSPL